MNVICLLANAVFQVFVGELLNLHRGQGHDIAVSTNA